MSTAEDIHIVCLFPSLDDAMNFDSMLDGHRSNIPNRPEIFGNQFIMDGEDEVVGVETPLLISATDLWMEDALKLARACGAHVRPAHIDRDANGIVSVLGDIPAEYGFGCFEVNSAENIESMKESFPYVDKSNVLVCSDAHHLWDISEAENYLLIDDDPYSTALVRTKVFEYLRSLDEIILKNN